MAWRGVAWHGGRVGEQAGEHVGEARGFVGLAGYGKVR
jgi:hypothetical protein